MAFAPYATDGQFHDWAQIAGLGKADQVDVVLNAATRAIDEHCQRHFWQDGTALAPVARTFEARCSTRVDFGPLHDLSSAVVPVVETDEAGDGTFETTWAAGDYQLLPFARPTGRPYTRIEAAASRRFPTVTATGRRDRVRVTGVWGWDEVPQDVHLACLIKATRLFTRMQSPNGIAGLDQFGPVRISRTEDPDVVSLLGPYVHPAAALLVA